MLQQEQAKRIQELLDLYFPQVDIPLKHQDPYTLLIAVLLSAQCTDARVNIVTPALFAKASTPEAMVKLTPETIESLIASCGLAHTKALAIWQLSRQLCERHHGIVPKSFEALEALQGVGHKTASVVMCGAFGIPAFPVDTHIHRCAQRWGLSNGSSVSQTEKDLKNLYPEESWNHLHLQIIHFARRYCPARHHQVNKCPICREIVSERK